MALTKEIIFSAIFNSSRKAGSKEFLLIPEYACTAMQTECIYCMYSN